MPNFRSVEDECEHVWVYSNIVLTSYPAQYPRICQHCGLRDTYQAKLPQTPSYDELLKKFYRESQQ